MPCQLHNDHISSSFICHLWNIAGTNVHSLSKHISKDSHHKEQSHLWRQSDNQVLYTSSQHLPQLMWLLFQWSDVVWTFESNKYTTGQNMIQTLRQVSDADSANLKSTILQEKQVSMYPSMFHWHVFLNHATRRKRNMAGNFILPNANWPNWHCKVSHESCTEKGVGEIQTVVDVKSTMSCAENRSCIICKIFHNTENWQILINM